MEGYEHCVRLWKSEHENGWEAWVGETPDGRFVAWTCPAGAGASAEYVEDTESYAKAAALFALERQTGHRCTGRCVGWQFVDTSD